MKNIRIGHLYGNLMNTYGDNGNLLMLQHYAKEAGYQVETTIVSLGDDFLAEDYDLLFFGGGQDYEQKIVSQDLPRIRDEIASFIENDGVMLTICGGFQLLGQYYINAAGDRLEGMNILPHYTERQIDSRFIDDIEIYDEENDQTYYGFENHNGVTHLGPELKPLGRIVKGNGNNGVDQTEGVHYKNTFGSYFHGPLLVRNEWLARHIVELAIQNK
ncbi:adenosylcobyric acid synthase [Ruoffia tabacinasalis]|uniref:Lipid II isoglutaminyl synthase (glutamine-hydrolyzing) subunit GatD n=1 Tax=Ruoffia tabacinasalis TaxID=87458 RepID=A0A5R9DVR0_9LACT|nr:phosphoribosylformylglycinamidine synthase subunit PurQ [Ruoffia tabacinasalis]TLQ40169.1 adenosylcobyric acid synthase [Ruoffia tabacinasalis]